MNTKNIIKAAGIVIKDKKILLVTANNRSFYWTPGGKLEADETPLDALKREFQEELGVEITETKHYLDYVSAAKDEEDHKRRQIHAYLVEFIGKPHCAQEITALAWVSRADLMNKKITLQAGIKNHLLPKLIEDNLL